METINSSKQIGTPEVADAAETSAERAGLLSKIRALGEGVVFMAGVGIAVGAAMLATRRTSLEISHREARDLEVNVQNKVTAGQMSPGQARDALTKIRDAADVNDNSAPVSTPIPRR